MIFMKRQLVTIFNQIRDIPYKIPTSIDEVDCCCSGKHVVLKKEFEKLGYECKYRVCSFKWSELNLPSELYEVPHQDDSTHVYLEIKINGEWKNIDATWDNGITKILPVNKWDGESDTRIAVPVIEFFSDEESDKIMTSEDAEVVEKDLKTNGEFYNAFNSWLMINRIQKIYE